MTALLTLISNGNFSKRKKRQQKKIHEFDTMKYSKGENFKREMEFTIKKQAKEVEIKELWVNSALVSNKT